MTDMTDMPERFKDENALDEFMSQPTPALIRDLDSVDGDIIIIGVAGKMGPTLARMAKRAQPDRRIIGVARFSDPKIRTNIEAHGIETITADLLDRAQVEKLPKVANVIFMAGRKFGSEGSESLTWAMNGHVPALVADHFAGSRIIGFSTICVYPFAPVLHGGATENDPLGPPGEYAMSCIARERMIEHFSLLHDSPGILIRLSYAIDMRYGVLHDLAAKVHGGEPVDLTMGHVNVIWQGDACSQSLRALRHAVVPSAPLNVSGPETVSIRWLAERFADKFGVKANFIGEEASTAWLANTSRAASLFGYPAVPLDRMVEWTADWISRGMGGFNKATHFETRSGSY